VLLVLQVIKANQEPQVQLEVEQLVLQVQPEQLAQVVLLGFQVVQVLLV
jgi:hypothetical protein